MMNINSNGSGTQSGSQCASKNMEINAQSSGTYIVSRLQRERNPKKLLVIGSSSIKNLKEVLSNIPGELILHEI